MPRRGGRHYVMVKGAEEAMNAFKFEVARDLGLITDADTDAAPNTTGTDPNIFKNLTTEQVGLIGGTMVRRIQAAGEYTILQRYRQNLRPLMPPEALPPDTQVRDITNNGNPAPGTTVAAAPNTAPQATQATQATQLATQTFAPEPSPDGDHAQRALPS